MADRFNRVDNTAPIVDVAENMTPTASKSNFDENRKIITQAVPYAIIPIDTIFCLPNTEVYLNYDVQVTFRNPAVRKMLNGWRVYLHAYYNRCQDLWEGWNNFITKGRSGNISLKIPHIKPRLGDINSPFTPMSLYNYLGYPSEAIPKKNGTMILDKTTGVRVANLKVNEHVLTTLAIYSYEEINALKAVMYQKIWRDKYSPKNLLQDNKHLFPDNDDHFILSYNANEVSVIDYGKEDNALRGKDLNEKTYYTMDDPEKEVRIDCLRFRQFQGDRFTTASPFPEMLRGSIPNMDIEIDVSSLKADIQGQKIQLTDFIATKGEKPNVGEALYLKLDQIETESGYTQLSSKNPDKTENGVGIYYQNAKTTATKTGWSYLKAEKQTANITNENGGKIIKSAITLSQLRSLEVMSIFAERMARTNGDYNEMIKAQFGYNPKSNNREAIYIGGSFQDIVLNSIYQTSESTDKSALGQQVAQGISASYNKLGNFHANDYGFIMVVMSIVPDTIYTTGLSKLDTSLTFEEQYFPIMNNLNAEPILNKELFVSGNKKKDNDLWGYAERFSEYKSRRNHVSGFSELPNTIDEYDSALVMARRFNKTPQYNADFVTGYPENYSLDGFTSKEEPPFDVAIRQDVNVMYPMPYVTIPQGLGTRA